MLRRFPPTLPEAGTVAYQRGWLILQLAVTPFWIQKAKVLPYQRLWILRTNGFSSDNRPTGNDLLTQPQLILGHGQFYPGPSGAKLAHREAFPHVY